MAWLTSEPTDGIRVTTGTAGIRDNWTAIQTTVDVDHYYMGQTNDGEHKQLTLNEVGSDPGNQTDKGFLYTKNDGGDTELFYEDAAGNVIQMTEDGYIKGWTLLETGSVASNAVKLTDSAIEFANEVMIVFDTVSSIGLGLSFSIDAGSNYNRSVSALRTLGNGTFSATYTTSVELVGTTSGTYAGFVKFDNIGNIKTLTTYITGTSSTATQIGKIQGCVVTSSDINAVQFSAGTLVAGNFNLYVR